MRRHIACGAILACSVIGGAQGAGIGTAAPMKHSHRYQVAAKLAAGIRQLCRQGSGGCALQGQAWVIEQVGWREQINPGFMVGASFTESSGGASPCCGSSFDIWGWYAMPAVSSWRDAFTRYARFIRSRWPDARDVWSLYGYCSCGFGFGSVYARTMAARAWGNRTASFMARMGFGGGRLAYP